MDKKEKERLGLYGDLVVDFANAATSDEACLGLIEKAQRTFNFSPDFAERAKKVFPSLRSVSSSLSKPEKILLRYGRTENRIRDAIHFEIRCFCESYPDILSGHELIDKIQRKLKDMLADVVGGTNLYDSGPLIIFLVIYRNHCNVHPVIQPDGSFADELSFLHEGWFCNLGKLVDHDWFEIYRVTIAYCLVEFLKPEKNRELIIKCDECGKYISMTRRDKNRRFCGGVCKDAYHTRIRIESGQAREYKRRRREQGLDQ